MNEVHGSAINPHRPPAKPNALNFNSAFGRIADITGLAAGLREIGCAIGRPCGFVDQGPSPQFVKLQRRVYPARVLEVAVDQPVEEMANVEPAPPAGRIRIAHDVDRAAVGQQMIELRLIGELVDARQIDQQQPARVGGRCIEAI